MRILLLNWRDIRSARGGGAERVTQDVARGLVERGHAVSWLSSCTDDLPPSEVIDGVRIIRRGSELTTRFFAPRTARQVEPDVVLEEINTLPYLSPLWSKAPVLLYMNQLAREVWWYEAPLAVAAVGYVSEPLYLQVYRRCDAVTISASSRDDLRQVGIGGTISIAPMVADIERVAVLGEKPRTGALVAVGRLTPSKRYDHAIAALARLRPRYPSATLTLIGEGRCAPVPRARRKGCGRGRSRSVRGACLGGRKELDSDDLGRPGRDVGSRGLGPYGHRGGCPRHSVGRVRHSRLSRLGGRRSHRVARAAAF